MKNALIAVCMVLTISAFPVFAAQPFVESPALAERFPEPPETIHTPSFSPGHNVYTSNDELHRYLTQLISRTRDVRLITAGKSYRGVAIEALHFSRAPHRPTVVLIGQQHGNEPAAAEAMLAIAYALGHLELSRVLDKIDIVILPRANPDGAQRFTRENAQGEDINRDHLSLKTPEAVAIASLLARFRPVVTVDAHEYKLIFDALFEQRGLINRPDMMIAMPSRPPQTMRTAAKEWFHDQLVTGLAAQDLTSSPCYYKPELRQDRVRLLTCANWDYGGMGATLPLYNTIGIVLESRGEGPARPLHYKRIVYAHMQAIEIILRSAASHARELQSLQKKQDEDAIAGACRGTIVSQYEEAIERKPLTFLVAATGKDILVDADWMTRDGKPLTQRPRPCGYWISAQAADSAQKLRQLGLTVTSLKKDIKLHRAAQNFIAPAGSFYLPLNQPLADLAVAALELDAPTSFYARAVVKDPMFVARIMQPVEGFK